MVRGLHEIIFNMAGQQQHCFSCGSATKYRCITCAGPVCNRSQCSVSEENDEIDGWIANKSVSYCRDCNFQPGFSDKTIFEHDEVEDEGDEPSKHNPKAKTITGRKSLWTSEHLDDMVDTITNNESFKRKLIFTNNKRATNTEVYEQVLKQLKERHPSFPFTVSQMRTKFKWCISTCKKVALTIQTASGIKRFVEDKGFGKWFDALFPLIKSRDSCQPEQAIEPSTSRSSSPCSTPSELEDKTEDKVEGETRAMFVPIKKRKRKQNEPGPADKILKLLEGMIENDQTKDLLEFMRADAEKSRQHELECLRLLTGQSYEPSYSQGYALPPTVHQTWQQEHYRPVPHHFQGTSPQSWRHFEVQAPQTSVPQTPPSGRHPDNPAACRTFRQARNYTQL